jgi:hypothetical protein
LGPLAQAELDLVQVTVSHVRRLNGRDDPLAAGAGVGNDDLDGLHALSGAPGDSAAAVDKHGEFTAQARLQALQEPRGEAAAFACCQA